MIAHPPTIIHRSSVPPLYFLRAFSKLFSIFLIDVVMKFHTAAFLVGFCSICPYSAGNSSRKLWHCITLDDAPWHQMQRDFTPFKIAGRIPVHQCCIPQHRRSRSAPLQNSPPHGLMQAHRERHKPTSRKRGALLEQYHPLSEHGNRQKGR